MPRSVGSLATTRPANGASAAPASSRRSKQRGARVAKKVAISTAQPSMLLLEAAGDHGTSAEGAHAQQERWRRFYHPFGDPFVHRRKLAAERQKREAEAAARARRKASRAKEKE